MKKKSWFFVIVSALIITVSFAVYWMFFHKDNTGTVFQTETVKRRDIAASVQATGVIRARIGAEVKVGARISGRVERLYANIGDVVKKGQLIARLEQVDLQAKVDEARMNLKTSEANLDLAKKTIKRIEGLYAEELVSRDKLDVAERDLITAQAQVNQIRENIRYNETQMRTYMRRYPVLLPLLQPSRGRQSLHRP